MKIFVSLLFYLIEGHWECEKHKSSMVAYVKHFMRGGWESIAR